MSAVAVDHRGSWEALLLTWQELDVPEGWRAEIVEGGIAMTFPPGNGHNLIVGRVHRQLVAATPRDWAVCQTLAIAIPGAKRLYQPDLVIVPRAELTGRPDDDPIPAGRAKLAVEIVSTGSARTDRVEKLRAYGEAAIPLYLLIDRFAEHGPSVTLFSEPADSHYRRFEQVRFGSKIELPEPINLTLITEDFS